YLRPKYSAERAHEVERLLKRFLTRKQPCDPAYRPTNSHCAALGELPESAGISPQKERPPLDTRGGLFCVSEKKLRPAYILGLQAFRATLHLEFHLRTLFQRPVSVHLDSRKMHEYIIA